MALMTMVQALNRALDEEMAKDPRVVVLGEDVGKRGGVFLVTEGLLQKYGPDRVMDTPSPRRPSWGPLWAWPPTA